MKSISSYMRCCMLTAAVCLLCGVASPDPATAQSASDTNGDDAAEMALTEVYNWTKISDQLASSGQIAYDQIELLKQAGYEVVVNLATASEGSNALEGFLVTQQGLTYVQIPVPFSSPPMRDLEMFFDVMEMSEGRKVYVHCAANMRASAFVYLYRTLVKGVPEEEALADMHQIWDPTENEAWGNLVRTAKEHYALR